MAKAKKMVTQKSGIRAFKPGELMFTQGDTAESLYIIQKGQIRLFIPKGRGFVDLAILRSGEVIGEMGFFDEKSQKRSCSATAIVTTEVIEISYNAFGKTMAALNPWFKTIINTLADRLRKTNLKVKELEVNSVAFGAGGKVGDYVFFKTNDAMQILSTIYLVMKSFGEKTESGASKVHISKLKYHLFDIYRIKDVKFEEFFRLLKDEGYVSLENDEDKLPKILRIDDIEAFRSMVAFFNTQKKLEENKKVKISYKCEQLLDAIVQQLGVKMRAVEKCEVNISLILENFKKKSIIISDEDLRDAVAAGLCDDILVGNANKLTSVIDVVRLKRLHMPIKMMNSVQRANELKSGMS